MSHILSQFVTSVTCLCLLETRVRNIVFFCHSFESLGEIFILFSSPPSLTDQRPPASEETMLIWSPHGHATMTLSLLRAQMMVVLALAVLLCPLGGVTGQGEGETQSPAQVLQDLLARHGDNSTITVPQLRALLALLSKGQGEGDSDDSKVVETPTTTPPKSNSSRVRTNTSPNLVLAL